MKQFFGIIVPVLLFLSCSREAKIRNEIQASLNQCVLAVSSKDIALYMKGIPDDFEIRDENGALITKEMQREYALRDWAIIDTTLSNEYTIDSLIVFKDSAIVFTRQKWKRMMFRKDGVTIDTVLTTQKHRELWKKDTKSWHNYHIEELGGKIYINGKPYYP